VVAPRLDGRGPEVPGPPVRGGSATAPSARVLRHRRDGSGDRSESAAPGLNLWLPGGVAAGRGSGVNRAGAPDSSGYGQGPLPDLAQSVHRSGAHTVARRSGGDCPRHDTAAPRVYRPRTGSNAGLGPRRWGPPGGPADADAPATTKSVRGAH